MKYLRRAIGPVLCPLVRTLLRTHRPSTCSVEHLFCWAQACTHVARCWTEFGRDRMTVTRAVMMSADRMFVDQWRERVDCAIIVVIGSNFPFASGGGITPWSFSDLRSEKTSLDRRPMERGIIQREYRDKIGECWRLLEEKTRNLMRVSDFVEGHLA